MCHVHVGCCTSCCMVHARCHVAHSKSTGHKVAPDKAGPPHSAVQCSAVQCSAVQCSAVQCSAVQCSVVRCAALHCTAPPGAPSEHTAAHSASVRVSHCATAAADQGAVSAMPTAVWAMPIRYCDRYSKRDSLCDVVARPHQPEELGRVRVCHGTGTDGPHLCSR